MGRKRTHEYNRTAFAIRIEELQRKHNYTNEYVLEHLLDENNCPIINDLQVLDSYKSGKRKPRDFDEVLKAFARFYDVTGDYLLGLSDTPNPQIKSLQEATGMSEEAVRQLICFQEQSPHSLAVLDAILSSTEYYFKDFFRWLYEDLYSDYELSTLKPEISGHHKELLREAQCRQNRVSTQYFLQNAVAPKLSDVFEQNLREKENERLYFDEEVRQGLIDFESFKDEYEVECNTPSTIPAPPRIQSPENKAQAIAIPVTNNTDE